MSYRLIGLSRGEFSKVSPADYEALSRYKWQAQQDKSGGCYAVRYVRREGRRIKFYMHRVITDAPSGSEVDHKNRDSLDNTRENLRVCPAFYNAHNRYYEPGVCGYRGVSRDKRTFRARITFRGEEYAIGWFKTPEEAALAYDRKALELLGQYAYQNLAAGPIGGTLPDQDIPW